MNNEQKIAAEKIVRDLAAYHKKYPPGMYPMESNCHKVAIEIEKRAVAWVEQFAHPASNVKEEETEPEHQYCHNYDEGISDERCDVHCGMDWCKPEEYNPLKCFHCGHYNNAAAKKIASLESTKLELEARLEVVGHNVVMNELESTQKEEGLFEKYDHDYEMFPLPIEMDAVEENKALRLREKKIRDYISRSTPKDSGQQWISVEERLPEKGGAYLTFGEETLIDILYFTGTYFKGAHENVTHWMPLPSPPTQDKPENGQLSKTVK